MTHRPPSSIVSQVAVGLESGNRSCARHVCLLTSSTHTRAQHTHTHTLSLSHTHSHTQHPRACTHRHPSMEHASYMCLRTIGYHLTYPAHYPLYPALSVCHMTTRLPPALDGANVSALSAGAVGATVVKTLRGSSETQVLVTQPAPHSRCRRAAAGVPQQPAKNG